MATINTQYYTNLKNEIEHCATCDQLKEIASSALAEIAEQQATITRQIAALQPILALVNPPTSLNSLISWVGNFINGFIKPTIAPYAIYQAQLVEMGAMLTEITSALQNASHKFPNCSL